MNQPNDINQDENLKTKDYYLRLRGLPYSAKENEIKQFFEGLTVDEVQVLTMPDGRASGEAFVGFASTADAESGMLRDKNKIGTRYVEVFRITEPEFARVRNYGSYSTPYDTQSQQPVYTAPKPGTGGAVRVRGLPYSCKQNELISFFQGLNVEEVVFGKEHGDGRPSGEAYVKFATSEDAEAAMQFNGQHLGKRYLELFVSNIEQFERFKRQQTTGAQPLNSFSYDWNQWYGSGWEDYYGGWDPYASANAHSAAYPRTGRGGYRGSYHNYKDYGTRATPYDYHGRVYGNDMSAYDPYSYPTSQPYSDPTAGTKVHMRGLPFRVNASQIIDFFNPLQCVEIKLGYLPDGRASGDGIVEFATQEEVQEAMKKDRQMIGSRYIEIFSPNQMKVAPGTTYKKIGGTGKPQIPAVTPAVAGYTPGAYPTPATGYEQFDTGTYDYQW